MSRMDVNKQSLVGPSEAQQAQGIASNQQQNADRQLQMKLRMKEMDLERERLKADIANKQMDRETQVSENEKLRQSYEFQQERDLASRQALQDDQQAFAEQQRDLLNQREDKATRELRQLKLAEIEATNAALLAGGEQRTRMLSEVETMEQQRIQKKNEINSLQLAANGYDNNVKAFKSFANQAFDQSTTFFSEQQTKAAQALDNAVQQIQIDTLVEEAQNGTGIANWAEAIGRETFWQLTDQSAAQYWASNGVQPSDAVFAYGKAVRDNFIAQGIIDEDQAHKLMSAIYVMGSKDASPEVVENYVDALVDELPDSVVTALASSMIAYSDNFTDKAVKAVQQGADKRQAGLAAVNADSVAKMKAAGLSLRNKANATNELIEARDLLLDMITVEASQDPAKLERLQAMVSQGELPPIVLDRLTQNQSVLDSIRGFNRQDNASQLIMAEDEYAMLGSNLLRRQTDLASMPDTTAELAGNRALEALLRDFLGDEE